MFAIDAARIALQDFDNAMIQAIPNMEDSIDFMNEFWIAMQNQAPKPRAPRKPRRRARGKGRVAKEEETISGFSSILGSNIQKMQEEKTLATVSFEEELEK